MKAKLITTRKPNYRRANIIFKDGLPTLEGEIVEEVEINKEQYAILQKDPNITVTIIDNSNDINDEELIKAIVNAWEEFSEFTKENMPKVKHVEQIVGLEVTAEHIKEAFNIMNAED